MSANQTPPRGQHWLVDRQLLAAIAEAVEPKPADLVVEIGPGRGNLTDFLLAGPGNHLLALEIDPGLVEDLGQKYAAELQSGRLRLKLADCRRYDWESLSPGWRLCANIPYYLTAFLLRQLTDIKNQPAAAVLLIPQPVAAKLSGGRGSLLAVIVGAQYQIELLDTVAPAAFEPPPKVMSQVIRLKPWGGHRSPEVLANWADLCRFWRQAFNHPRQTLANNLKSAGYDRTRSLAAISVLDLSERCRPGELGLDQWLKLWRALI